MARHSSLTTAATWLAAGTAVVLSAGCESRTPTATGESAAVPLRITAVTLGTPISTLIVEVTAADLPSKLVFNLTVQDGVASGTIKIPPGPARTIHVSAVDDEGNVTHDGSVTIDVNPGQNPPVQVKLRPRSGQVPITVTFGNYTVLVAPTAATIDATVMSQLQLTPTVIDVDGQHIASPQVGWATTQPAVAVVDQNGLVTGIANGTATIVATFEGVAGLSEVTVKGIGVATAFQYPACLTPEELELATAINATRQQIGLSAVPVDTRLVQAARANAASITSAFVLGQTYGYAGPNAGNRGQGFLSASLYWEAILQDTVSNAQRKMVIDDFYLSASTRHIGVGFSPSVSGWGDMAGSLDEPVDLTGSCTP
jgi:uncharacterized protein YkwD